MSGTALHPEYSGRVLITKLHIRELLRTSPDSETVSQGSQLMLYCVSKKTFVQSLEKGMLVSFRNSSEVNI
jgi:hypothetical protein